MADSKGCCTFVTQMKKVGKGKTLESGLRPTQLPICKQRLKSVLKFVNPLVD